MCEIPFIEISQEMIQAADKLVSEVNVKRTKASSIDTLTGILGEFVFAHYLYGDWHKHFVGKNKGKLDFPDVEIKTSAFPFSYQLNLLVREDYARKRQPPFYIQIIIDVSNRRANKIDAGAKAYICGYATHEEVINAPLKDMGSKLADRGGYKCRCIPITQLHPMNEFQKLYDK